MQPMSFALTVFHSVLATAATLSVQAFADSPQVQELKGRNERITLNNQNHLDNFAQVRAQLDPLVAELEASTTLDFAYEKRPKGGAWQQLWTEGANGPARQLRCPGTLF
jgi:hypothetical protein